MEFYRYTLSETKKTERGYNHTQHSLITCEMDLHNTQKEKTFLKRWYIKCIEYTLTHTQKELKLKHDVRLTLI